MKRLILLVGLILALGLPAMAQTPISTSGMPIPAAAMPQTTTTPSAVAPVASCVPVNVGAAYVKVGGQDGTMIEAAHPITSCARKVVGSIGFVDLLVPKSDASIYLVGGRGDIPFANVFPKADPIIQKLGLFGGCGMGTAVLNPANAPTTNHFAYGCQGGFTASPGSLFGASVQIEAGGGFVGYDGHVYTANTIGNLSSQVQALVMFNIGNNSTTSAAQAKANAPVAPAK